MSYHVQMLKTQWAWSRLGVLGLAVITFAMPSIIWRLMSSGGGGPFAPFALIQGFQTIGAALGLLALAGGAVVAAQPWVVDAEAKHVYALSLPIAWPKFVSLRFGIGVLLMLVPALGLYLGSWFVLLRLDIPEVLNAYPGALALRYFVALTIAYSGTFALQYIFGRRAALVVLVTLISFGVLSVIAAMLGVGAGFSWIGARLFEWPGPLAIFTDSWKLLDV
jgi:hypothetical protein